MTLTQKKATKGQVKQLVRVATDAAKKAVLEFDLDKDSAQRVHGRGDELVEAIRVAVASLKVMSVSDKHKDEEVPSPFDVGTGYVPCAVSGHDYSYYYDPL